MQPGKEHFFAIDFLTETPTSKRNSSKLSLSYSPNHHVVPVNVDKLTNRFKTAIMKRIET